MRYHKILAGIEVGLGNGCGTGRGTSMSTSVTGGGLGGAKDNGGRARGAGVCFASPMTPDNALTSLRSCHGLVTPGRGGGAREGPVRQRVQDLRGAAGGQCRGGTSARSCRVAAIAAAGLQLVRVSGRAKTCSGPPAVLLLSPQFPSQWTGPLYPRAHPCLFALANVLGRVPLANASKRSHFVHSFPLLPPPPQTPRRRRPRSVQPTAG